MGLVEIDVGKIKKAKRVGYEIVYNLHLKQYINLLYFTRQYMQIYAV